MYGVFYLWYHDTEADGPNDDGVGLDPRPEALEAALGVDLVCDLRMLLVGGVKATHHIQHLTL